MTPSGGRGAAEARTTLQALIDSTVQGPASLFFGGNPRSDGTAEYRSVEISKELAKDLVHLANTWLAKIRRKSPKASLREYDCAPQPEGQQKPQFIDIEEDPYLDNALKSIAPSTDLLTWTPEDREVRIPRSIAIKASLKDGRKVRFFGRLTKGKQLGGPGRLVAFFEGSRFQALVDQRVIIIDPSFDCCELDRYLIILKPGGFESLFAYDASLSTRATATIDTLKPFMAPEQLAALRSAVGTNRNHLRQIAGRIRIDLQTVDPEKVREAIRRCKFNVTIDTTGDKLRLSFVGDDPHDLIRLLTDRGVESIISGKTYIATALESVAA